MEKTEIIARYLQDFIILNPSQLALKLEKVNYPVPRQVRVNNRVDLELSMNKEDVVAYTKKRINELSIEEIVLRPLAEELTPTQPAIVSLIANFVFEVLDYLENKEILISTIQKDEKKARVLMKFIKRKEKNYAREEWELDATDLNAFLSRATDEDALKLNDEFSKIQREYEARLGPTGKIRMDRLTRSYKIAGTITRDLGKIAEKMVVITPPRTR